MSIVAIRSALNEVFGPQAKASNAAMSYRGNGQFQVITFKLSAYGGGQEYELVLPGAAPLLPTLIQEASALRAKLEVPHD